MHVGPPGGCQRALMAMMSPPLAPLRISWFSYSSKNKKLKNKSCFSKENMKTLSHVPITNRPAPDSHRLTCLVLLEKF